MADPIGTVTVTSPPEDFTNTEPLPFPPAPQDDGDAGSDTPTVTIGQSQATPAVTVNDDGAPATTNSPGYGAGNTNNSATSVGADDNPGTNSQTQQLLSQTFGNGTQNTTIIAQPNVLDRYASYTYSLSWYLLSPTQYNQLTLTQPFNTAGWQLLMQSAGAPITGRNQYFPVDFYMDDLEIESLIPGGGTARPYNATYLRWKVTEPNGITLIQRLYNAVNSLYQSTTPSTGNNGVGNQTVTQGTSNNSGPTGTQGTSNTTNRTPNYLNAQHCMVIRFYGYDDHGNLVYPATGQYTTNNQLGGSNQTVIIKYYPFRLENITYRVAKSQIEYSIKARPFPHNYNIGTSRATIPYAFALTGQTVGQLLSGTGQPGTKADPNARTSSPNLPSASNAQQGASLDPELLATQQQYGI
jgi:hypothetical protein